MSRTYNLKPTWAGHGYSSASTSSSYWANSTHVDDPDKTSWYAGYNSGFHSIAFTFDTSAVRDAVSRGYSVTSMYLLLKMSNLKDYTRWSLAYKKNSKTDGTAGTWTRSKATDQTATYSEYNDYLVRVRTGYDGCVVEEAGTEGKADWLIRIPIPISGSRYDGVPVYGFTLANYNSSSDATRTYTVSKTLTNHTLVIVTTEPDTTTYTLSYNANGGSGAPASQSGEGTGSYTFTVSNTIPTYQSHTFTGWDLSSSATSATYHGGDSITITENKTLYAVWVESNNIHYKTGGVLYDGKVYCKQGGVLYEGEVWYKSNGNMYKGS